MSALKAAEEVRRRSLFLESRTGENSMTTRKLVSLAVFMLLLTGFGFGQGVATGDLHITVNDPHGNLVTNATVTVRDLARGLERTTTANTNGEYRVVLLLPGNYTVVAQAPGFANAEVQNVAITVGGVAELP